MKGSLFFYLFAHRYGAKKLDQSAPKVSNPTVQGLWGSQLGSSPLNRPRQRPITLPLVGKVYVVQ